MNAPEDRSGMLLALGIVQTVIGGLCGLFGLIGGLMFGSIMSSLPGGSKAQNAFMLIVPILVYFVPAGNLLLTGIGTLLYKPWARLATIISSSIWLGLFALFAVALAFATRSGSQGHAGIGLGEALILTPLLALVCALPIILISLYTRPGVRATFERRHAQRKG